MKSDREIEVTYDVRHAEPLIAAGAAALLADAIPRGGRIRRARPGESPTVTVVDLAYITTGAHTAPDMLHSTPALHYVVLTHHCCEDDILGAVRAGVLGYVVLGESPDDLIQAVYAAARGQRHFCAMSAPKIAEAVLNEELTQRERTVLQSLAMGQANKLIARELDISLGTVKAHVRTILSKLCATSRTEAASIAIQRGLVRLSAGAHGWQEYPA